MSSRVRKTASIKPLEREKPYPRVEVMKRHPNAPIAVVRPRHVEDPEGRWDVQHFRRYLYRYTDVSREMEDKLVRALIEVVPNPGSAAEEEWKELHREVCRLLRDGFHR